MAKNFKFNSTNSRDGFHAEFPSLDFERLTAETEEILQDKRSLERYQRSREQMLIAQRSFKTLVDSVNSMSNNNLVALAFCKEMTKTHRTLQQSLVGQLLIGIRAYAEWAKENNLYDARNEAFVKMADDLERLLEDHPLPFV